MKKEFSLYLDVVRVFAAVAVLVSHLGYDLASAGKLAWAREYNIGSDAVVIFFVLSGLLISHTVQAKDRDATSYALARLSRLWSVAIPAALFSAGLAFLGAPAAPEAYPDTSVAQVGLVALQSLGFTNYLWFSGAHLPGNNPFWSVTYEFWYYAAFGFFTYATDRVRWLGVALILLIMGPRLLLLFPCWLLGVALQRALSGPPLPPPTVGWALFVGPVFAYAILQWLSIPAVFTVWTKIAFQGTDPNVVLGFSDEFLWNFVLSLLTSIHFFGAATISRTDAGRLSAFAAPIRWMSARTFSLYLFHMPILVFIATRPTYDPKQTAHLLFLIASVAVGTVLLAEISENRLSWWRKGLERWVRP